jgi:HPr kinase/phosphorylase
MAAATVASLYDAYHQLLQLRWLAGKGGATRNLVPEGESSRTSLIGHLNFIHPHRIQVLGASELAYLGSLGKNSYQDALQRLFSSSTAAVIVAEGESPPPALKRRANQAEIPLLGSQLQSPRLLEHLSYYLRDMLADTLIVHGVFMDVLGIGVLLTGQSAVGKSELALELISRGHGLIADDAPEFIRTAPDAIRGSCPPPLRDFLEVRGLGILNVRAMFGDNAVKDSKRLRLIVHLAPWSELDQDNLDRLHGSRRTRTLLEVEVPEIVIPVAPGRNLAVLVEAAARNYILYSSGQDAAQEFIERQRQFIEQDGQ